MESTYVIREKENAPAFSVPILLRKLFCTEKCSTEKIEKDYSAFGNTTAYEKKVIDRLRADGLADADIVKCLREL